MVAETTNMYGYEAAQTRENLMEMEMEEAQLYEAIDHRPMEMIPFEIDKCIWGLDQQPSTCSPSQPTDFNLFDKDVNTRRGKMVATERQRRIQLNAKYKALTNLIPNPINSKPNKASIVEDAIGYTKGLLARVAELKVLVEKKKKKRDMNEMRSSRLERKSRDTEVDVRLIDDQLTIKLLRRNNIDCLLHASKALQDLHLDPLHVVGGHFGDLTSFWFHIKVHPGSCVCATAIANKLIQAGDTTCS